MTTTSRHHDSVYRTPSQDDITSADDITSSQRNMRRRKRAERAPDTAREDDEPGVFVMQHDWPGSSASWTFKPTLKAAAVSVALLILASTLVSSLAQYFWTFSASHEDASMSLASFTPEHTPSSEAVMSQVAFLSIDLESFPLMIQESHHELVRTLLGCFEICSEADSQLARRLSPQLMVEYKSATSLTASNSIQDIHRHYHNARACVTRVKSNLNNLGARMTIASDKDKTLVKSMRAGRATIDRILQDLGVLDESIHTLISRLTVLETEIRLSRCPPQSKLERSCQHCKPDLSSVRSAYRGLISAAVGPGGRLDLLDQWDRTVYRDGSSTTVERGAGLWLRLVCRVFLRSPRMPERALRFSQESRATEQDRTLLDRVEQDDTSALDVELEKWAILDDYDY